MTPEPTWRGGSLNRTPIADPVAVPLFGYTTITYGQPVRITTPGHSYIACVRKVHRKGDRADGAVTGFMAHGSDFDAFGRCRLTPWVSAEPVVWPADKRVTT